MTDSALSPTGLTLGEPAEMAEFLHGRPVASSPPKGWDGVVLQRFRDLPAVIDLPPMRDAVLVCHLNGPFLAETGLDTPHYQSRWIGPGELGVNPAGTPVHRVLKGRPDIVLLYVHPDRLRAAAREAFAVDPSQVVLTPTLAVPDDTADCLIRLLLREAEAAGPSTSSMVDALTRALTVHILRAHSNLTPRPQGRPEVPSPGRMQRVIQHMRGHLDRPLPLAELASLSGLSPSRLTRAFRQATGQPPHRFLVRLRIEEACRLLEETDLSITEVSMQCGFDGSSHFASMFRRAVGTTPGTWRRERRN
jgi:AraC family transcriptional regulator